MADISNKPWGSIAESDYADAEDYCGACLIDENPGGQAKSKGRCSLPVREPRSMGRALNRNAVHAAAAALSGARSPMSASPASKRSAARKLLGLYSQLQEDPPETVRRMAG